MASTDRESGWKEAITNFPHEALGLMVRAVDDLDRSENHEVLEQELRKLDPDSETGKQIVDVLLKAFTLAGDERYLHCEIQAYAQNEFAQRLYTYNYRIEDRFRQPVFSFAILIDADPQWLPDRYTHTLYGKTKTFEFAVFKVLAQADREQELLADANPFAVVVLAQLYVLQTAADEEERARKKLALLQHLQGRFTEDVDRAPWYRYVDWIMVLPEEYDALVWQEFKQSLGDPAVPYVTYAERVGLKKGLEKGLEQGLAKGLEQGLEAGQKQGKIELILEMKHGEAGLALMPRVRLLLDPDRLDQVLALARGEGTLDEILALLPEVSQSEGNGKHS